MAREPGAAWVPLSELHEYPLRGSEVEQLLCYVAGGAQAYPLDLLQYEGMPYLASAQTGIVAECARALRKLLT